MCPEPTSGFYHEAGIEAFIRKYGYKDRMGRMDRINFGGIHKAGERQALTGLTMAIEGFDATSGKITDTDGGVVLRDDRGTNAAEWKFTGILEHWKRKHALAVYVPSIKRNEPLRYHYGNLIRLGTGTSPLRLLDALSKRAVYYDPGIKMENASGSNPRIKRRSQFRVKVGNLDALYNDTRQVDLMRE
jgi:hypothetical protein